MMSIEEAISIAKALAASARALERINQKAGYKFMPRDAGNEAEVLEALVRACESTK